ncbi:hypothetical protein LZ30DRAFT_33527 [Colletotrichum cereale]|nr:hypothetical protein LZ30DRAFT_33527 [Colletotrichum cereale]
MEIWNVPSDLSIWRLGRHAPPRWTFREVAVPSGWFLQGKSRVCYWPCLPFSPHLQFSPKEGRKEGYVYSPSIVPFSKPPLSLLFVPMSSSSCFRLPLHSIKQHLHCFCLPSLRTGHLHRLLLNSPCPTTRTNTNTTTHSNTHRLLMDPKHWTHFGPWLHRDVRRSYYAAARRPFASATPCAHSLPRFRLLPDAFCAGNRQTTHPTNSCRLTLHLMSSSWLRDPPLVCTARQQSPNANMRVMVTNCSQLSKSHRL